MIDSFDSQSQTSVSKAEGACSVAYYPATWLYYADSGSSS